MIRKFLFYLIFPALVFALFVNNSVSAQTDTVMKEWEKMNRAKVRTLQSFQDQKFGMFIHWGLYAIPGGIWKGKKMEEMGGPHVAEWIQLAARIPRKEYAELAAQFNPVSFNADGIVKMAKLAGMKYLVITAKHHDGFAMYKSAVSPFNVVEATPFRRDVVAELYNACQKNGLAFGIYYSHNIDWADGSDAQYKKTKEANDRAGKKTSTFGANLWDPSQNTYEEYLSKKAVPQVKELLRRFPATKYVWFDMPELMTKEQSFLFYKTVWDINPKIIITERIGNGLGDYAIPGDNKIPSENEVYAKPWETVGTFNNSWGYKSYDHDWKSPDELLYWLVEIVSKGGNYMLNIGPRADGSVPQPVIENLKEIGAWMEKNHEAIYGASKWKVTHEGPSDYKITDTEQRQKEGFKLTVTPEDFWFTQKDGNVYVIALKVPAEGKVHIRSLGSAARQVKSVTIQGLGPARFRQSSNGLSVTLPDPVLKRAHGYSLKVVLKR
ncbi:alpha-L-fucosidase [Arcticibacter tournemirensis]